MTIWFRRRPQSDTLVSSGFKDRRWLLQFSIVISVLIVIALAIFYFGYERRGSIVVTSSPAGAEVYVDKKPQGVQTPAKLSKIKPGSYLVEVRHPTLIPTPYATAVKITPGSEANVAFRLLTPAQEALRLAAEASRNTVYDANPKAPTRNDNSERMYDSLLQNQVSSATSPISSRVPSVGGSGRIFVTSDVPGADIYLNGSFTSHQTDAWLLVPLGTYRVQVRKDGFIVDPLEQSVLISQAFQEQKLGFQLAPVGTVTSKKVKIVTDPIEGVIRFDGNVVGKGEWESDVNFGTHIVEFAPYTGYVPPAPIRLTVSATDPSSKIVGHYSSGFACELSLDGTGHAISSNLLSWKSGIRHPTVNGFKPDKDNGPPTVFVKQWRRFAWEFGMAFPSRNPVGGQYLEFEFTLPKLGGNEPPMYLWVQAVQSTKNYPLSITNRTIGVIEINGRILRSDWTPSRMWDTSDPDGWERHAISERLIAGKNMIRIYSHDNNLRYFYVSAVRIGPQSDSQ